MGKIAIGTDSGGIPEAILDNETGFLIPHGDIDRLITLLDELLSRPADYEAIRQQARHRALDEFDWTSRMQKILEIETTHIPA
jgi:glycosyltransferase involved in cell wall biosynthesis